MDGRFRARVAPPVWAWLRDKPEAGAHPTHAFHVLDVFPRVGLMTGGDVTDVVALMDSCRIRWGRVLSIEGEWLSVDAVPLRLTGGKLELAEPQVRPIRRWLDGAGFVADVAVDDTVSLHWDWACEVLEPARLAALRRRTQYQLRIANATL
jgi:hypothetical protein